MSPQLWTEPEVFNPSRFLTNGRLVKPDFFLPFGAGRRQCIGYKMVNLLSFSVIATIMQNFNLLPVDQHDYKVPIGSLHMPEKTYEFKFVNRE
jgi:cytochrome P450 family 307 subfamily A